MEELKYYRKWCNGDTFQEFYDIIYYSNATIMVSSNRNDSILMLSALTWKSFVGYKCITNSRNQINDGFHHSGLGM